MNNSIWGWLKGAVAAVGGVLAWFFGPWDVLIMVLIAFVVADYLTGVVNAAIQKQLSSTVGFKGLWKKVLIFIVVGIGTLLDRAIPAANGALRAAVCLFYIANEGLSILENAAYMGLPLPKKLKEMLMKLKEATEDETANTIK